MKKTTRLLSAALALCLLLALGIPARAAAAQDCGAKLLAITFDDGPGNDTGALLDGLAERGVTPEIGRASGRASGLRLV